MTGEQRNLLLAILLSVGIIFAFQYFYEIPRLREQQARQAELARQAESQEPATTPGAEAVVPSVPGAARTGVEVAPTGPRIRLDNGRLHGSIALQGARIDDVTLADYHETPDKNSPEIRVLAPVGSAHPYFVEFGWIAGTPGVVVPDSRTLWQTDGDRLGIERPVRLRFDNGRGLVFAQTIEVDGDFMLTITRSVRNDGSEPVTLYPYGLVSRWDTPPTLGFFILHEGPLGVLDGRLHEIDYDDLKGGSVQEYKSRGGWIGITDKYWLAALVPQQDRELVASFRWVPLDGRDRYQVDFRGEPVTVAPGQVAQVVDRVFVGAKEVDKLDRYEATLGVPLFDRAVDFGWFYFLTKPIFHILHFFYKWTGNYGVAILLLTLLVKIAFFPLANKSYRAMSHMKKLQPEMMRIRELYADDKVKMNQELMALYQREKVNPMAGCLPIVVQIPVFFALYKVLFVSIEMRHAPFFGWIKDLSAPDPTSIFNLFGLLPYEVPGFLTIGVWPIAMGATMWLQQKLNPQPADPVQAKVMNLLPIFFTFLFATFPAGLVIYWTWNNLLSIAQQWLIMKRMGVSAS
ncbi:MAG: membrane protein insertase YidC [Geminicoccaceae bacterium]|nr:membrane protein insertase YidC [Geminicoccaceae bacterium]MCS7267894.1 membrane protein insertase YidC [Geminicoccaceae bacterium]MDW8124476.1 membrane protein insertase YidC [Geminicoccaceae bacterium]MDW8342592.1 membrane protein insertase YidC [Geminicoccaceae bacterium]